MPRLQFKPWRAPSSDLIARLGEGEVAIRAEDGAFVRRPSGQPTAALEVLGTNFSSNVNSPAAISVFNTNGGALAEARLTAVTEVSTIGLAMRGPGSASNASTGFLFVDGAFPLVVSTNSVERLRVSGTDGTVSVPGALAVTGDVSVGHAKLRSSVFSLTSGTTSLIDSFSAASFRSVKYEIQIKSGSSFHVCEIRALRDGTFVNSTEHGEIVTNLALGSFTMDISGGSVQLFFTPTFSATFEIKILRTLFAS